MAIVKVVGVSESKGEYKGYDFHNLVLHVERKDKKCVGLRAEQKKVHWEDIPDVFGLEIPPSEMLKIKPSDFTHIVGKDANVYYDQYGNLERYEPIETK